MDRTADRWEAGTRRVETRDPGGAGEVPERSPRELPLPELEIEAGMKRLTLQQSSDFRPTSYEISRATSLLLPASRSIQRNPSLSPFPDRFSRASPAPKGVGDEGSRSAARPNR